MTHIKPKTVDYIRESIKDLPDDMPVFLDDENDCLAVLRIEKKVLDVLVVESGETKKITALVIGIT